MSDLKTKPLPRYPKDENELGFKTCFFEQDNTACQTVTDDIKSQAGGGGDIEERSPYGPYKQETHQKKEDVQLT